MQTHHLLLTCLLLAVFAPVPLRAQAKKTYVISAETINKIEQAAPTKPFVEPAKPRRILVYGRMPTHPESVVCCFKAMEILAKKTGAFEVYSSGDPAVFLPDNLQTFDAVVMNNTHERFPLLPWGIDQLSEAEQKEVREREPELKRSLLAFIADGRGIVGIHGATAGNVQWPEFVSLFGAQYMSHVTETVWVKPEEPSHPLCAFLDGKSFEVHDEIYFFRKALTREPFTRGNIRVLMSLDLSKTKDPGRRQDKDYLVSWVRPYGKGRVFYTSLGHCATAYTNRAVLQHYLAGIQYAIGDLKADDHVAE